MKGDFSRLLFDPKKRYRGVLMQMGRVLTDNDHNAEHLIHEYLERTTNHDIIGGSGFPKTPAGQFQVAIGPGGGDLTVGAGHCYVEGLLCETDGASLLQQPQSPYDTTLASITDLAGAGVYMVYLDVWERHVTALEDPAIRETALGGPDTTTRVQTVWHLRVMKIGTPGGYQTCANAVFNPISLSNGRMTASVDTNPPPPNSCAIVPQTGYRRLENQLYRIEIHRSGKQNAGAGEQQATFKWSRDNGSVVASILGGGGSQFNVDSLGRDDLLGFATDNWVELIDDPAEFSQARGELRQIGGVVRNPPQIQLRTAAPAGFGGANSHARIRRWDQTGGAEVANGIPLNLSPLSASKTVSPSASPPATIARATTGSFQPAPPSATPPAPLNGPISPAPGSPCRPAASSTISLRSASSSSTARHSSPPPAASPTAAVSSRPSPSPSASTSRARASSSPLPIP
jgi:hypothetical protein